MQIQDGTYENPWLVGSANVMPGRCVDDDFDDEWVLCSTEVLVELMSMGRSLRLPEVELADEDLRMLFPDDELAYADARGLDLDIESIELVGEEEVQCIEVEDLDHMYLTDSFVASHNTSNIVFLKSTDDSMIETLQKMSGTKHESYIDSKTVTRDMSRVAFKNKGETSYTMSTREVPVVSYNDLAFLSPRNSIVFRAGDSPIWNTNQTILPMSWRLFANTITHPGHEYSLPTIPTLSSARDFDVRKNQPNFESMLDERVRQALVAQEAMDAYRDAYGYDDYQIEQLDPDNYANAIMEIINTRIREDVAKSRGATGDAVVTEANKVTSDQVPVALKGDSISAGATRNKEQEAATQEQRAKQQANDRKRFAEGMLASSDLWDNGRANHSHDDELRNAWVRVKAEMLRDTRHFSKHGHDLYDASGKVVYIKDATAPSGIKAGINKAASDPRSRTHASGAITDEEMNAISKCEVTDAFCEFLAKQTDWLSIAGGRFDRAVADEIRRKERESLR